MAAITFPIAQASFGDLLPVQNVDWEANWLQELSQAGNGEFLVHDLAPRLWVGQVTLRPLLNTVARGWKARLDALDGGLHTFYLANPLGWYPALDPGGTILASAAPVIGTIEANRKELSITGLPSGYVISSGDFFAVSYGTTRRGLFQFVGEGTANGFGTLAAIEVRPHIQAGITDGLAIMLKKPAAKVKIIPGSLSMQMHSANRSRISFSVRQTLQAGD